MKMFNGLRKRWDKWLRFDLRPPQEFYHPREWGSGSSQSLATWQLLQFQAAIENVAHALRGFVDACVDTILPEIKECNAVMLRYRRHMLLAGIRRYWLPEPLARWLAAHCSERWL